MQQSGGLFGIGLAAIAVIFHSLAYAAPFTSADGAIFLLLTATLGQRIRPFLLLFAAGVQDAPGCSYLWSYISFAGISFLMIADYVLKRAVGRSIAVDDGLEKILTGAIVVVLYGAVVSALHVVFDGYEQSSGRPYFAVGGLMLLMAASGYVANTILAANRKDLHRLGWCAVFSVLHGLAVGAAQLFLGQSAYRSETRLADVESVNQLVEAGAIGFARINGPFLSPNAFGYMLLLLGLVLTCTSWKRYPRGVFLFYSVVGACAVILSMSKALLGYYVVSACVMMWFTAGRAATISVLIAGFAGLILVVPGDVYVLVLEVFRVQEGTLGSRQWSWLAVINELQLFDWIFGIGLSAWPAFFEHHVGIPLSDPHSLPLSITGTFGIAGVVFYLMLLGFLAIRYESTARQQAKLGIVLLVFIFLVKDMVSIPAVLGNTQLTFMIWLLVGLAAGNFRQSNACDSLTSVNHGARGTAAH